MTAGPDITLQRRKQTWSHQLGCRSRGVCELGLGARKHAAATAAGRPHTTTSPDGRTFVFSRANGLWKADSSGGREMLLTSGEAYHPVVTPDNRWIIFLSSRTGQQSPWIISIDGGEPRQLLNVFAGAPGVDISPDGTRLIFSARNTQTGGPTALMCELPDCTRQRYISTLAGTRFRWTPDGRRIAYIDPEARTTSGQCPWTEGRRSAHPFRRASDRGLRLVA